VVGVAAVVGDIVLRHQEQADLLTFAKAIVGSALFTEQGITSVERAAIAIVAGREIGIGPVESMRSFHFANGGVQPSADLLARLVRRHPRYDYRVCDISEGGCELEFFIDGAPAGRSRFTEDDRRRAHLGENTTRGPSSWAKFPRNMMFSRALTNGVAWYCPDVIDALAGAVPTAVDVGVALPVSDTPGLAPPDLGDGGAGEVAMRPASSADVASVTVSEPSAVVDATEVPGGSDTADEPSAGVEPRDQVLDPAPPATGTAVSPPGAAEDPLDTSSDERLEQLWVELEDACVHLGRSPMGFLNASCGTSYRTDDRFRVSVAELERSLELLPEGIR
jgi:hypothetical protein